MPKNDFPAADALEGVPILAIRKDTATALANKDHDYTFLQTDSKGHLRVTTELIDDRLLQLLKELLKMNDRLDAVLSEIRKANLYLDHMTDLKLLSQDFIE